MGLTKYNLHMKVTRFEDLECWQAARELVKRVYEVSQEGALSKDWDARSQFRRASVSVMNNIAEGFARYYKNEFKRFLDIAQSSAAEVKSMLYLFEDLQYLDKEAIEDLHSKVNKTRNFTLALIRYLDKGTST